MTEQFIVFLWKHRLFHENNLVVDGEKVEILSPGQLNPDAGPDFFDSRIKIGNTIWAGNIEIHVRASDWFKHGHHQNAAFDNVILQVVHQADEEVFTSKGLKVPTIQLEYNHSLFSNYEELLNKQGWIACENKFSSVNKLDVTSWITTLGIERLESKTKVMEGHLHQTSNDWEEIFYRQLARSFGFHVNSTPFEMLAQTLPYKIIRKHEQNLEQLEALLFGQAGFLNDDYADEEYKIRLSKEYGFLKQKYELSPIDIHLWKFLRLRPNNFPTIRIAQFAAFLHKNTGIVSQILEASEINDVRALFKLNVSHYWDNHYIFGNKTNTEQKIVIGNASTDTLIINAIVPLLFLYGKCMGKPYLKEKAISFLEALSPEQNSIIKHWGLLNLKPSNAFDSQALLQLKNEYCDRRKCIECRIGAKIITSV